MKLALMADLHGNLPPVEPVDLVVIAGDVMPMAVSQNPPNPAMMQREARWLQERFYPYVSQLPAADVVMCWGNHDWIGERSALVPTPPLKLTILTGERATFYGLNFYGLPWTNRFFNWAFNADSTEMAFQVDRIPEDTDILVSHGPPLGYQDTLKPGAAHLGSAELSHWIRRVQPRHVICGHIHGGAGESKLGETTIHNVSVVDEGYRMVRGPKYIEL